MLMGDNLVVKAITIPEMANIRMMMIPAIGAIMVTKRSKKLSSPKDSDEMKIRRMSISSVLRM
jgi:hypothetical protein